jgi:hypothetical protein
MDIQEGGVFVKTSQDIALKTPLGTVHAGKGAIVSVRVANGETRVQSCGGRGSVQVKVNGQVVALTAGMELILSDHASESTTDLANDGIARRELSPVSMGEKVQGSLYEFSMVSLLGQLEAVKQPASPYEKQLAAELVKTAAIMQQVVSPRGSRYIIPSGPGVPQFDGRVTGSTTPPVTKPTNEHKDDVVSMNE